MTTPSLFHALRRWFVQGVCDNYGPLMYAVGFAMGWSGCWAVLH